MREQVAMAEINAVRARSVAEGPRSAFPGFEQVHLTTYVQLADAKASVFLAITSGAIAYSVGHYGLDWLHPEQFLGHSLLVALSTLLLVTSWALNIAVIIPRKNHPKDPTIFYDSVARFDSPSRYADVVLNMADTELFCEQMAYCHALAKICALKYRLLNYSLVLGIIGYATFLALLLFQ